MNRAIHSGNTRASSEAFGAIASGIDGLGAQDVNVGSAGLTRHLQNTESPRPAER